MGARPLQRRTDPAGHRDVVVLDQHRVVQAEAVIGAAAQPHRLLFEDAQAGGRLAGADDFRLVTGDRIDQRPRRGRNPGQAADQVQRGPLAGEHGARVARDAGDRLTALDAGAVPAQPLDAQARIEQLEGEQPGFETGEHAGLTRRDHRVDARVGGHDRIAGDVAGAAEIFEQRGADDRLDQDAQHSHSTGPPASGPCPKPAVGCFERLALSILQQICSEQPVDQQPGWWIRLEVPIPPASTPLEQQH